MTTLTKPLDAISRTKHELIGKLVRHHDCPNEHFFVEKFEGEYKKLDGTLYDRVWVRGVERYADQSFPACADELEPVTIN